MPLAIVTKDFKFAHFGYQVEEFIASDEIKDLTDECFEIAEREGWVRAPAAEELNGDAGSADVCTDEATPAEPVEADVVPVPEVEAPKPAKRASAKE